MLFSRPKAPIPAPSALDAAAVRATLAGLGAADPTPVLDEYRLDQVAQLVRGVALSRLEELPAFPRSAAAILDIARRPEVDLGELVKAASADPTVSLELVRVSNAASQGNRMPIRSVHDAAVRLGARMASRVAAAVASRAVFDSQVKAGQRRFRASWDRLWKHASSCAFAASELSADLRAGDPGSLFLGGLFHDIGVIPALRALGELADAGQLPFTLDPLDVGFVAERVHCELGALVAERMQLPQYLARVALQHHAPPAGDRELHVLRLVSGVSDAMDAAPGVDAEEEVAESLLALDLKLGALASVTRSLSVSAQRLA